MSKKFKPVVLKVLDISTAHMTRKDNTILSHDLAIEVIYDKFPYGYYVQVPKDDFKERILSMEKAKLSQSFIKIIKWAHKKNIDWVKFDADADKYPNKFKTYEW